MNNNPFYQSRIQYRPAIPNRLALLGTLSAKAGEKRKNTLVESLFPNTGKQGEVYFQKDHPKHKALRIGVVLSGGQAPGGHDVIAGLFDGIKQLHPESELIGFLDGPSGILKNRIIEIDEALLSRYRNTGGFTLIGSGRTKIETVEQFAIVEKNTKALHLDALIIIGGDDSNTNAALLAEYLAGKLTVIGVPKTIDGDLKGFGIEASFGFDTASKVYSSLIGNVALDALSAKKYYFFIKLMGRSASHITLETALKTHPNLAFISEEIAQKKSSLKDVTKEIADLVQERAQKEKFYGVILLPEGIIEAIPEFQILIEELNALLGENGHVATSSLTKSSQACFALLPKEIQKQLLLDRDPHGNVQVSKIDSEKLFIELVKIELERRGYEGPFSAQPLFFGYEGRSAYPSNFDVNYCYSLGLVATLLADQKLSGYMAAVKGLAGPLKEWEPLGVPISQMVILEKRKGRETPVIKKSLVDLDGEPFRFFYTERKEWRLEDDYCSPGPIQYFGDATLTEGITKTLQLEHMANQALA